MAEILDLPDETIETHPLMPYPDYLKHLDFDIGLAPLTKATSIASKAISRLLNTAAEVLHGLHPPVIPIKISAQNGA